MKKAHSVPVLMYHHVSPSDGAITVSPKNFEDQLAWLARNGYCSLTTDEFAAHLQGEPIADKSVLITFDDGYLDNWVYAYPLLKKYGYKATIFIVTSWVGEGEARPVAGQGQVPHTPPHVECEQRIAAGDADSVMLRWSEIRAMQESGLIEFHSHTHTHTRWDKSERAHEKNSLIAQELEQSRKTLIEKLGSVSEHFCWPQGYFDADYVRVAQQAGFKYLYTTHAFGQNLAGSDPAHIHRFAVRNTTGASVGRRIQVASNPVIAPVFNRFKLWKRARRQKAQAGA
ncbi:MAG TPA: polysaccharide deacetylase family protein [Pusillimonas sp.]|uniref:polysaccharide deacetylase family protein n=1 Tax=unclassified Pusillimonas TaxID=2640016 RepID=UPI002609E00A|nr:MULTISPECIES: polysaccharide deacetylase family protein [unclassified Pusillimonas]HLU20081.1 polysaccharide deacetylase family protein [Pusillimonas sp.]